MPVASSPDTNKVMSLNVLLSLKPPKYILLTIKEEKESC